MKIRFAGEEDLAFLSSHDGHISAEILRERVAQKCVYIAEENGAPVGWLRYNLFWDNTPFCNLIFVSEKARGRGVGDALLAAWERGMRAAGYSVVMTSTQAREQAQIFFRTNGYADAGGFFPHGEGYELVLLKVL